MKQEDMQFMSRALQLASLGKGRVSPNPLVGCVIVHKHKIIGEGWHQKAGEPHAEVLALQSVKDDGVLKEATVYVTLEPCSHFGKTPPCADLLIDKKIKRVVIGSKDPNPLVAGQGIEKLREAGIDVIEEVLNAESIMLNKAFFTYINKKRPYIILKWAQTSDRFVARHNYDAKWISSVLSRQLVHQTRSEVDAILVGKNTVLYDNPTLTTREWAGHSPIRCVIDHNCILAKDLHIKDRKVLTYIFNLKMSDQKENLIWVKLSQDSFINDLMAFLYAQNIQSVLIEGGTQTIEHFIELNLWDEARVFTSPNKFEKGILSPQLKSAILVKTSQIEDDQLQIWNNPQE
jgi:diaminohydroxyphosphoribosylaminopyrimidine deaminase/5-amino-6-(5-phosphoribosylamino)uracil reductase